MPRSKFPKMPGAQSRRGSKQGGDGGALMGQGSGGKRGGRGGMQGQRGGKGGKVAPGEHPNGSWETESGILGDFAYNAPDGKTYYGREGMEKYEQDHPGEGGPHDGITHESGMYWGESSFHGGSQQQDQYGSQPAWGRA